MTASVLRSIHRLTDPVAKLNLLVKYNLIQETKELINSLLGSWDIHLFCALDESNGHIFFDTLKGVPKRRGGSPPGSDEMELKRKFRDRVVVAFSNSELKKGFHVDLVGMSNFLDFNEQETVDFVSTVLKSITKTEPNPKSDWRLTMGVTIATRQYFKTDDDLARAAERWVLLSRFREGRIFELRGVALPVSQERPYRPGNLTNCQIRDELDPIIERMKEVGMTMKEIREEFLKWIEDKSKAEVACRYQFMLAVAGARCFKDDPKSSSRRRELLRTHYLPCIVAEENVFYAAEQYAAFTGHNFEIWSEEDSSFFLPRLEKMLSEGLAGAVYQWLLTYGKSFKVYSSDVLEVGRKVHHDKSEAAMAWEATKLMATKAVELAEEQERFGVAAALCQHFADAAPSEKMLELATLALDLEQPILLSWRNAVEKKAQAA